MRSFTCLLVLAVLALFQSGCVSMMDSTRNLGRQMKRIYTFRADDYRDLTEEESEDWTSSAGREGRANQPMELDPDPWWRNVFMSEKARDIERNVGIE